MAGFLIEVPHKADKMACIHAIKVFRESGSHFLSNAEWGCSDNEHKAWLIVDVDTREEALQIVPPAFRQNAKVISLFKVTREMYDAYMKEEEVKKGEKGPMKYHS